MVGEICNLRFGNYIKIILINSRTWLSALSSDERSESFLSKPVKTIHEFKIYLTIIFGKAALITFAFGQINSLNRIEKKIPINTPELDIDELRLLWDENKRAKDYAI